jgi:hypothetical protein
MSGKLHLVCYRRVSILFFLSFALLLHLAASAGANPAEVPIVWCSLEEQPFPDEPWFEKKTVTVICDGSPEKQELSKQTIVRYLGISPHVWDPRRGYALPFNAPLGKVGNYFRVEPHLSPDLSNARFTQKANAWLNKKFGAAIKEDWNLVLHAVAVDENTLGLKKSDATERLLETVAGQSQFHQAIAAWGIIPKFIPQWLPLGADTKDSLSHSTVYFAQKAKDQPSIVVIQGIVDKQGKRMDLIFVGEEVFAYKHDGRTEYRLQLMPRESGPIVYLIGDFSVGAEASHMDMTFMGDRARAFNLADSVVARRPDRRSELVILKPLDKESAEHQFAIESKDQLVVELSRRYRNLFDLKADYRSAWKRRLVRDALDASQKLVLTNTTRQELGFFWTYISETAPFPRIDTFVPETFVKEAFDLVGTGDGP